MDIFLSYEVLTSGMPPRVVVIYKDKKKYFFINLAKVESEASGQDTIN